jgi:uncharacterized protein (TIGR02466 family)
MPKNKKGFDPRSPWEKTRQRNKASSNNNVEIEQSTISGTSEEQLAQIMESMNAQAEEDLMPINPFPIIFKSKYDFKFKENHQKIFEHLLRSQKLIQEEELITPEKEGGTTSVVLMGTEMENMTTGERTKNIPPHAWPEFKDFTEKWLPDQLDKIWEIWKLEPNVRKFISESWINVHPKGAYTAEHAHNNVTIAMACYFSVPPDSGRLLVKTPLDAYKYSEPINREYDVKEMYWSPINVETNDVVFFPGWLRHKTEPNNNKDEYERFIMSCNVRFHFGERCSTQGMQNLPAAPGW